MKLNRSIIRRILKTIVELEAKKITKTNCFEFKLLCQKKKDWRKYVLRKKAGFVKELGYANILYFFPKKEAILFDPFAALASAFDFADT